MNVLYWIFMPMFVFVSFIMVLLVLIQKGRGGGLSGAFGGGGSGNAAFGAKTGDVLTWATSVVFALFVLLAVVLNLVCNNMKVHQTPPPPPTQQVPVNSAPSGK